MSNYPDLAEAVAKRLAPLLTDEGFAVSGDLSIHYRMYGAGPAIVLLHGFPDYGGLTFAEQIEDLARDYLVITPTLRGFPPSTVPTDPSRYSIPDVQQDIVAVLDHLGIEKAHVGGHDWGGAVIQAFALFNPQRVNSLIILNSPISQPFRELVNSDPAQQELSAYTINFINYEEGSEAFVEPVTKAIRDADWREAVSTYIDESPLIGMLSYYKANYPPPPYGAPAPASEEAAIFISHVPTLIVWGLEDEFFSLEILNNLWKWFSQSYRLVTVPGAGHWAFRDQPAKVNAELRSWLNEQS